MADVPGNMHGWVKCVGGCPRYCMGEWCVADVPGNVHGWVKFVGGCSRKHAWVCVGRCSRKDSWMSGLNIISSVGL